MLRRRAAEVFTTTPKYNHCKICCSTNQNKCLELYEGLCLLEITLFELWPKSFLAYYKRPKCQNAMMVSGRHSSAAMHVVREKKKEKQNSKTVSVLFMCSSLTLEFMVNSLSWWGGHLHLCKNDFESNYFQANTPVNILWLYSTLFVLVCDNQAIGKQLSIIHIYSSEFIRMVKWWDT